MPPGTAVRPTQAQARCTGRAQDAIIARAIPEHGEPPSDPVDAHWDSDAIIRRPATAHKDRTHERQMRILRYHPRAATGDGGMSNAIRRWSRAVSDVGAASAIAFGEGRPPRDSDQIEWIRVDHRFFGSRPVPMGLDRVLRGFDLLVLHGGWSPHNVVAGRAAARMGVPYLLEPRGAYDPHILGRRRLAKAAWWSSFERGLVDGARAVHLFFETESPHLRSLGYRGPFVVAPNGVDVPGVPTWDGGSGGYLLWYGRFDPQHKGVDVLVDALSLLPVDRRPALRLHGPEHRGGRERIRRRVRALGLEDRIVIGGPIYEADKEARLSACTGFVYPSRWEGFGIAPAEAVARGVPLLATPYPFARYLADRGGAVVVPARATDIADGLDRFLDMDRAALAAAGARTVGQDFRWEAVARSWLGQVEALL